MPHDPRKCLEDMRAAALLIRSAVSGRSRDDYLNDLILRAAVERQFEIIGEAINRLRKLDVKLAEQIPEHRRIISFRNVLAHGYDCVDHQIVWLTISNKLPALIQQIDVMLNAGNDDSQAT